jgi:hypothetical protein
MPVCSGIVPVKQAIASGCPWEMVMPPRRRNNNNNNNNTPAPPRMARLIDPMAKQGNESLITQAYAPRKNRKTRKNRKDRKSRKNRKDRKNKKDRKSRKNRK